MRTAVTLDAVVKDTAPPTAEWIEAIRQARNRRDHELSENGSLPTDPAERKRIPMATGLLDYFPAALAAVAQVSLISGEQHHPGQPMHWERGKSTDHADTLIRHLTDRGRIDSDGIRHSAKVAWRALALLQEELEEAGAAPGRASVFSEGTNR